MAFFVCEPSIALFTHPTWQSHQPSEQDGDIDLWDCYNLSMFSKVEFLKMPESDLKDAFILYKSALQPIINKFDG